MAPFEKAGYQLKFYELDENLHSIFDERVLDEISVLSLCGYYGFCSYDHDFVRACKDRGIVIFEDVTHSLLSSDGIDPLCDCPVCRRYSRAYLRHLFKAEEMLAMRLSVLHNLYFYNQLAFRIRQALDAGTFDAFRAEYSEKLSRKI